MKPETHPHWKTETAKTRDRKRAVRTRNTMVTIALMKGFGWSLRRISVAIGHSPQYTTTLYRKACELSNTGDYPSPNKIVDFLYGRRNHRNRMGCSRAEWPEAVYRDYDPDAL